eukprot:COSAG06_NODE_1779_length_8414_cov_9.276248_2_plen_79_part_00
MLLAGTTEAATAWYGNEPLFFFSVSSFLLFCAFAQMIVVVVCIKLAQQKGRPYDKPISFLSFSYVCPEPVLAKSSFLV